MVPVIDDRAATHLVRGALALMVFMKDASVNKDMELGMIVLAIYLGWLEGRPYDVSGLAAVTHIPRATITRKLQRAPADRIEWRRQGRRVVPAIMFSPAKDRLLQTLRKIVMETHAGLARSA